MTNVIIIMVKRRKTNEENEWRRGEYTMKRK